MRFRRELAAVTLLLVTTYAFPWGRQGHRLVALVAGDHLTAVAAENVAALLGRETMADVASFGDDYRTDHPETAPWHFVDIPGNEKGYVKERDCPLPVVGGRPDVASKWRDCAVDRIAYFIELLKDPAVDNKQKTFALKMLIHLIGDLHQPLHAMGDARGGNQIRVMAFGSQQCGSYACNLHGVWDVDMIEHHRLDEKKYLAMLEADIAKNDLTKKPVGTPIAWANASHRAAVEAWVPNGGVIGKEYYESEIATVDRELEFGGLHLADVLNNVFTAPPAGSESGPRSVPGSEPVLKPR